MTPLLTLSRFFALKFLILIAFSCLADAASVLADGRPAGVWYGIDVPRAKPPAAIRLASYNVENLFDEDDDPTLSGEFDDAVEQTSESRLKAIAATIRMLDVDVLCLQEVESLKCLEWFRDKYLSDLGYRYAASVDAGYYRGVEQSLLSRFPVKAARVLEGTDVSLKHAEVRRTPELAAQLGGAWAPADPRTGNQFQRAPLIATVQVNDAYALTLVNVHFKAGSFNHQRELEALRLGEFVSRSLHEDSSLNLAVLGDFNATPNAMSVRVLRAAEIGLVSAYDYRWERSAPFDTYATHASGRPLDYILMSTGLAADCVPDSFFVLGTLHAASNWDYRRAKEIPPPDGYASDHYPVVIDVSVSPDRGPRDYQPIQAAPDGKVVTSVEGQTKRTGVEPAADDRENQPRDADETSASSPAIPIAPPKPAGLKFRPLTNVEVPAEQLRMAEELLNAGWIFRMPKPKSSQAGWGIRDSRTTWWVGYWINKETNRTSTHQPDASSDFAGDGRGGESWRRGGSPPRPTLIEWLCSESDGIEPEADSGAK